MRVFAFEFFSGGGFRGPLPASIAQEGDLMLRTLVRELAELPGIEVIASRDPRLPPLPQGKVMRPRAGEDPISLYLRGLAGADAGWPTAPETGGMLERLGRETLAAGKILLGCAPEAVRVTASKRATAQVLSREGIPVVPTFNRDDGLPPLGGPWVTKPDDGAGCEETRLLPDWKAAREFLAARPNGLVAQPWIEGEQVSLSLICADGVARLLSCNRQQIGFGDGQVRLDGIQVNAASDDGSLAELGDRIAAAIPDLWGYVGVDLVLTGDGPMVLEINPRLTTSYCGLGPALGINTASIVMGLLDNRSLFNPSHAS